MNHLEEVVNRLNTHSVKWDMTKQVFGSADVLPMWIADMDFKVAPEIIAMGLLLV